MHYIADIHIHSYYSRATSKNLNLEHLNKWAQIKGLKVVATGDITHPQWLEEMRQKLEPATDGLFRLKPEFAKTTQSEVPGACNDDIYFILTGEISNIYKRHDQVRKVHNVVMFPTLDAVAKFQNTLDKIGNIRSDGRPILGLDSRDLLEIVLETDDQGVLIPAHIWTPWFSMLGSKSGFDTVEECFGDLTPHIFAMETGLSSDPPMNWRLSMLDKYNLVSNSDAHSPAKLAREANIFDTELSYPAMISALRDKNSDGFWGTLEFFPEEGKYHMDGHRKCNSMTYPADTIKNNGLCPVCGKPATLGVSYRVEELADRPEGEKPADAKPFMSLVPLPELISEEKGVGPNSKTVQTRYFQLLNELGSELDILMNLPLADIEKAGGSLLAEGIRRMREAEVLPQPGYDGEYGIIRVFQGTDRQDILQQGILFQTESVPETKPATEKPILTPKKEKNAESILRENPQTDYGLNQEQRQAVSHRDAPLIIKAGPGTGKTRTLTERIASLVLKDKAKPEQVLAVTFTHKAADEMRDRLAKLLSEVTVKNMQVLTFHALGAQLLRKTEYFAGRDNTFSIIDTENDKHFQETFADRHGKLTKALLRNISIIKGQGYDPDSIPEEQIAELPENFINQYRNYEELLTSLNAVDYDDLVLLPVRLLRNDPDLRRDWLQNIQYISVDEFQDINRVQYELLSLFSVTAQDICVIGDPDQAIYGFRGASNAFFDQFIKDFPDVVTISLKRNYRSAQNILNASRQILNVGKEAPQDRLWSNLAPEVKVNMHSCLTDKAEAEFIVHRIEQLVGGTSFFSMDSSRVDDRGLPESYVFSDMAVLLRSRQLLPALVEALDRSGIPFSSFDESPVTAEPVFLFLTSAFNQMIGNPLSDIQAQYLLLPFCGFPEDTQDIPADTENNEFYQAFLNELEEKEPDQSVTETVRWLWEWIEQNNAELEKSLKLKLLNLSESFADNHEAFLDALMLQTKIDTFDDRADKVKILTLHASKGLEFPVVFIPGCEENIIPHRIPGQKPNLDEERRLLYVGMTRAKQQLYLSHCKKRLIFGHTQEQTASRFLASISNSLLEHGKQERKKGIKSNQMDLF